MKIVAVVEELMNVEKEFGDVQSETRVYAIDDDGVLFSTTPGAAKWRRVELPPFPTEETPKDAK